MKSIRKILVALIVAGSAVGAVSTMTGCYASGREYIVEEAPPAARTEVVVSRPGFFWIHGHWTRPGTTWVWRDGYYERERPDYIWVEGRWERRERGHVWVDGGWRARADVSVQR